MNRRQLLTYTLLTPILSLVPTKYLHEAKQIPAEPVEEVSPISISIYSQDGTLLYEAPIDEKGCSTSLINNSGRADKFIINDPKDGEICRGNITPIGYGGNITIDNVCFVTGGTVYLQNLRVERA